MTTVDASAFRPTLAQHRSAGLDLTVFECRGLRELHLTVRPLRGETPTDTDQQVGISILQRPETTQPAIYLLRSFLPDAAGI